MKKITFCNSKGGVGETTSTVNVAQILAQVGKKSFVIGFGPASKFDKYFVIKSDGYKWYI